MKAIKHSEAIIIAKTASGDFSFTTIHDGSMNPARKGDRILWTYCFRYRDYMGAKRYGWL